MKSSLKTLAGVGVAAEPAAPAGRSNSDVAGRAKGYRTAQTRSETRQVSGHYKPEVSQTLRLIAVEQDCDVQEVLAEALNMLFARHGKATRVEVSSGRRKKLTT